MIDSGEAYSLISVILPVHNQADHLKAIVGEYQGSLTKLPLPHEIILVANACSDESPSVCRELASIHPTVVAVDCPDKGWGHAVATGLEAARGDLLCYTNLARTQARDLILILLYATVHPRVVVKANRKIRDNWRRRLGSLVYNLECRALFDLSYWDINGTPKVFPRCFSRLLELKRRDDLIDAEFNAICRREDYPVLEVPIFSTLRHGGKSTTTYLSALKMYWGAYRLWRGFRHEH